MLNKKISKFSIFGMNCGNCVRNIRNSLTKIKGIDRVSINFFKKEAEIIFDPKFIQISTITEVINSLGYKGQEIATFELNQ
ncbi:MAG: Mercuric transport protein periplasmic component precursor [Candidatus Heimdallarchaeota archaeon LC_3]|nr:MAG: Mercuric transport protein periplasmic component precursor [Candidatus Heimdallarchaeota archaeon LC_3]